MRPSLGFAVATLFFTGSVLAAEPTMCTMQYDPVCATKDGSTRTYGNSCTAGAEGAVILHGGECRDEAAYVPPASCTAWFDGCNRCTRMENGDAACTLMACAGEPQAGYCTAYAADASEEPLPLEEAAATSSVQATSATTSPADVTMGSFFSRLWTYLTARLTSLF